MQTHRKTPKRVLHSTSPAPAFPLPTPILKPTQYRSYQHTIEIYHFRPYITLKNFRRLLHPTTHGYIESLTGPDTFASDHTIPLGDDIPTDHVEAAYLPNIFHRKGHAQHGSALGFRSGAEELEWICFDRPIANILTTWTYDATTRNVHVLRNVHGNDERLLFDHVASLEKGLVVRRVGGANKEHRQWHTSLWRAEPRRVRLVLRWRNYREEAYEWVLGKKKREEEEEDEDGEYDTVSGGDD
jgi:hypothetical protein